MTIQEHTNKATLILDNTRDLYDRQMAIFSVFMKNGETSSALHGMKLNMLDLADQVVSRTNLSETADPHMNGVTFMQVAANVYAYIMNDYEEFKQWHKVENGKVISL